MRLRCPMLIAGLFGALLAVAMSFSQSWSNPGHKQSFSMVMDGLNGKNFTDACKAVTDAADTKCAAYYREIGMMKDIPNHRFMGHWGWAGKIPKATFERGKAIGVSENQIRNVWQRIHHETVDEVMKLTGLPEQYADPFAGILYDAHLLHDYTGEFSEALQDVKLIKQDLLKNLHRMFGSNSNFVKEIERALDAALQGVPVKDHPRVILNVLTKYDIGKKVYASYKRFLAQKGIKYSESLAAKIATGSKAVNEQFFAKSLSAAIKSTGRRIEDVPVQRIVKGVYSEITKNGKKAYRLQIPLQFSSEERIASQYARECMKQGVSEKDVKDLVAQRLRDPNLRSILKGGRVLTEDEISKTSANAARWAKLCQNKLSLGLKTGIVSFIITEGITVCTFAESDMSEEEFIRETTKNVGGATLDGVTVTVLVALGANPFTWPGGLIVLGVGIGTHIVYDFAWAQLQQHLDTRYFTIEDFLGNLPEEIRLRTNVLSPMDFESLSKNNARRLSIIDYQESLKQSNASSLDCPAEHSNSMDWNGRPSSLNQPISIPNALEHFNSKRKK